MNLIPSILKSQWGLLIIGFSLLWVSCIDEIQLDNTGSGAGQLVIQGQLLTGDTTFIKVNISRTADFANRSFPDPVTGATVDLENQIGESVPLFEVASGEYQLNSDQLSLPVMTGNSYKITVRLSEGSTYESSFEPMLAVPQADSISINLIQREELDNLNQRVLKNFVQFFLHTPLIGAGETDPAFLKWDFEGIYRLDETPPPSNVPGPGPATCFITRGVNLEQVLVYNGNEANGPRLAGFLMVEEEADVRFSQGFLLNVQQQSLSSGSFDYWDKVSQTVGLNGGLFEATPGKIKGNLVSQTNPDEEVLGYFYVSEQRLVQRFVHQDDAGKPPIFCGATGFNAGTATCLNCLSIPFSTRVIPEGWEL